MKSEISFENITTHLLIFYLGNNLRDKSSFSILSYCSFLRYRPISSRTAFQDPTQRNANFEDGYGIEPASESALFAFGLHYREQACYLCCSGGGRYKRLGAIKVACPCTGELVTLRNRGAPAVDPSILGNANCTARETTRKNYQVRQAGSIDCSRRHVGRGLVSIRRNYSQKARWPRDRRFFFSFCFGERHARFPSGIRLSRTNVPVHRSQVN